MGKPNFVIVEGSVDPLDLDEIYDDFKKDYLNPTYSVKFLREKYNLGKSDYRTLNLRVREETGLKKKPFDAKCRLNVAKNVYKLKYCYGLRKYINGKMEYFGYYADVDTAIKIRDKLYECNWDRTVADELYIKYGVKNGNNRGVNVSHLLPRFKELYADSPHYVKDICKELKIGGATYSKLVRMLREKYPNIKKARYPRNVSTYNISSRPNRYIMKNGRYYTVTKHDKSYGSFKKLQDAVDHRNKLEVNGWQLK